MKPVVLVGCGQVSRTRILPALKALDREGVLTIGDIVDVLPTELMAEVLDDLLPLAPTYHRIDTDTGNLARLLHRPALRGRPVIVATPTPRHAEHLDAALGAASPVALEKPLASSIQGLNEIARCLARWNAGLLFPLGYYLLEKGLPLLALARKGMLSVAQLRCLNGPTAQEWQAIRAQLGRVRSMTGTLIEGIDNRRWVGEGDAGGHTLETFSHLIAVALPWLESMEPTYVRLGTSRELLDRRTESLVYAEFIGSGGEDIVLACEKGRPTEFCQRWMQIEFDHGHALMNFETEHLIVQAPGQVIEARVAQGLSKYVPQLRMFAEKIAQPDTPTEYNVSSRSVLLAIAVRQAGLAGGLRECLPNWLDEQLRKRVLRERD